MNLPTALKNENKQLRELVTAAAHLLIKSGVIKQDEFIVCDTFEEIKDLFETKTLIIIKSEREFEEALIRETKNKVQLSSLYGAFGEGAKHPNVNMIYGKGLNK